MNNKKLRAQLNDWDACQEAMDWLRDRDSDQMWADCERADWLLWYVGHVVDRPSLDVRFDSGEVAGLPIAYSAHRGDYPV